jgi:hypothetical protein
LAASVHPVEGAEAVRILAHPDYDVVPYHDRVGALADRLQVDFGDILYLLDHLPLALRGMAHTDQRADVARLLADRRAPVSALLPDMVARHFRVLSQPGQHDLLAACMTPLVEALIATIVEADLSGTTANLVSRVFSQSMGPAQRRQMNAELAGLRRQIALAHPDETGLRHGSRLALVVLGRDALIGTLARSLHAHLLTLAGRPLRSIVMPAVPTHTGVPYIDRESRTDPTQVMRCRLQALEATEPNERLRFFGAGPHVCLGRVLTLDLFQQVSAHLADVESRITVTEFHLRKDDVFALPDVFTVTVSP